MTHFVRPNASLLAKFENVICFWKRKKEALCVLLTSCLLQNPSSITISTWPEFGNRPLRRNDRRASPFPFDKLRTGPSTSSGQALRQAQDRPFDKLRTGPSTSSGQALRQAQDGPATAKRVVCFTMTRHPSSFHYDAAPVFVSLRRGRGPWVKPHVNQSSFHYDAAGDPG